MSDGIDSFDDFSRHNRSPNQRYAISSSVLLTAVLCLVFVIVLITILHLYARYMLRSQAQRRSARAQFHRAVAHGAGIAADHQLPRPKTGLDAAVVTSLPRFEYKKKKDQEQDQSDAAAGDECSVCLSQLEEGETVRQLPACRHTFHDTCIDMWLYSHNTCPLCRKVIGPVANDPSQSVLEPSTAAVEVVVVVQVGGGGNRSDSRPSAVPQGAPPQPLIPIAGDCGGVSGQGVSGHATNSSTSALSPLSSFRRMFSFERAGGRRQPQPQQGRDDGDGPHRDLERQ